MAAHSPTPWRVDISPRRKTLCILSDEAWICGELSNGNGEDPGEGEANAAFIVRACNAHDGLIAALKRLDRFWTDDMPCGPGAEASERYSITDETSEIWQQIRDAIAMAEATP